VRRLVRAQAREENRALRWRHGARNVHGVHGLRGAHDGGCVNQRVRACRGQVAGRRERDGQHALEHRLARALKHELRRKDNEGGVVGRQRMGLSRCRVDERQRLRERALGSGVAQHAHEAFVRARSRRGVARVQERAHQRDKAVEHCSRAFIYNRSATHFSNLIPGGTTAR